METSTTPQQRRLVSVLFLDIVGSTALSSVLDPEDVSEVMDGALARFAAVVLAHGGRVLQFAGDSLLAAFGADAAREDDAERAVHAGLALLQAGREHGAMVRRVHRQPGFDVRVGVHTGHVLLGGGVDAEGTIRGFTVNIAARLEQTAPPGRLRISHDTWRQVRGVFDVEVQPPLVVKGQDEPLLTYLVLAARPRAFRVAERGVLGQETPLVGRDAELAQLLQAFEATAAGAGLHAITLMAEAGMGKSRLLHELQHRLDAHARSCWLLLGRAQPGGRLQPYGLLRDVLAWRLQIADGASGEAARAQLVQGLAPLLGEQGEADACVLGQLIGMDFSAHPALASLLSEPRLLRDRAFAAFARWLQALAASDSSPVVLMLDDLQWADEASLDWLAQLLTQHDLPLTLVLGARPALLEHRPAWGEGGERHACIVLTALGSAARRALTDALLQRLPAVPETLRTLVEDQAEGNPYYAEELVQMLIDDGVIDSRSEPWQLHAGKLQAARIPATLVGVLQARLDALAAAERRALQQASIVGPVFWDQALAALEPGSEPQLPALQAKAMVQLRPDSAFDGTAERNFHHHLLHQVTYDTVLKAERRSGHARAATWLAERVGDRGAEYLVVTAEHYERAGAFEPALDWYERALDTAIARFANRAALGIAARVLALPNLGDTPRRYDVLRRQTKLADLVADRALQAQAAGERLRLAEALDSDALRADATVALALLHDRLDERDEAWRLCEAAIPLALRADDAVSLAVAHGELSWLSRQRGDLALARRHIEAALPQATRAAQQQRRADDHVYEISLRLVAGSICRAENDHDGVRVLAEAALALAQQRQVVRLCCAAHESLSEQALSLADLPRAAHHIAAAMTAAASIGLEAGLVSATLNRAHLAALRGDWAAALADAEEGSARNQRAGMRFNGAVGHQWQAMALLALGRPAPARELLVEAEAGYAGVGAVADALACRLLRAQALWQLGEHTAALAAVHAEGPALMQPDALGSSTEALLARAAAWRVLRDAGDAGAPAQLALAVDQITRMTEKIADPAQRESARRGVPWHRELLDAAGA
jgi:class 3 adenylate cyclase/tetratricopeptide (TPR) repeat protein